MTIRSALHAHAPLSTLVCAIALVMNGCSKADSPTSPSPIATQPGPAPIPSPTPTPTPTPTPAPTPAGVLNIRINPNPVPQSGVPITDAAGCVGVRYTWYYEQVLSDTGGSAITLTGRIDLFDDRETNNTGNLNVVVPANGSTTIRSRWCSTNGFVGHTAQTRWTGTDAGGRAISMLGPRVELLKP
jgi:hypothetical protein